MTNKLQITIIVFIIPIGLLFWYMNGNNLSIRDIFIPSAPIMRIGDIPVHVEIANSDEERMQGLSGRQALEDVDGVLFVFPETGYHGIWMKDMQFPIDIIWINDDLEIISIDEGVAPETYPRTFRPPKPARYVLETNAHFADTFGIHKGQKVTLPLKYLDETK